MAKRTKAKKVTVLVYHWNGLKVIFNAFPTLSNQLHAAMYDVKTNILKWVCFDDDTLKQIRIEGKPQQVVV
ncbi:MAG: hypothetical protein ACK502_00750 [Alphaproteobacteria bacterium]